MKTQLDKNNTSTFIDNMSLPIHRWFKYTAGFSGQWVEKVITEYANHVGRDDITVLDPFSGSGTTLLSCDKLGVRSYGLESHPFVSRIASCKLLWEADIIKFRDFANTIRDLAERDTSNIDEYPSLIYKCYDSDNLKQIDAIKKALLSKKNNTSSYKLCWMAFVSILRCSSHAGTASWQYILPNKNKKKVTSAIVAFEHQVEQMIDDMETYQAYGIHSQSTLLEHDARKPIPLEENSIDLVITSPPYANNYDYADATRLELSILGEISSWGELQSKIRPGLVRSCTQMVSKQKKETYEILNDSALSSIHDEIYDVVSKLDEEKENHGGKKNYHTMIALYFLDLAYIWKNLRRVCKPNSRVCFVIGDSAPYGIYVPVDRWLGELAISAGFKSYEFEKIRDRNIKWKNRKHRVPLKEGRLWIKG